jgi:hypothetical protein
MKKVKLRPFDTLNTEIARVIDGLRHKGLSELADEYEERLLCIPDSSSLPRHIAAIAVLLEFREEIRQTFQNPQYLYHKQVIDLLPLLSYNITQTSSIN